MILTSSELLLHFTSAWTSTYQDKALTAALAYLDEVDHPIVKVILTQHRDTLQSAKDAIASRIVGEEAILDTSITAITTVL